ncbi:MAG: UDP-N-acetylmuramate dehydrogenase [Actinomycetes bacterium]
MSVERPNQVREDEPLSRYTTVGTGGPAGFFARCGSQGALQEALAWAAGEGIEVRVLGSGSNLLVADSGVDGLVVKLDRDLAKIEVDGLEMLCGGGARLPSVAAAAAKAGLSGLEFGVSIPGSVGGAVRMNANAYGGELARTLLWAEVVDRSGVNRRSPEEFDFTYRHSNLGPGEIVASARFRLEAADPEQVRLALADLRARRKEAQPWGVRTFGSTFKNPSDERAGGRSAGQLLDAAGCRDLRVGSAGFSEKHANFIVNHGDATTAEVVEVMAEGKRRVRAEFGVELEAEVQVFGPVEFPDDWKGEGP